MTSKPSAARRLARSGTPGPNRHRSGAGQADASPIPAFTPVPRQSTQGGAGANARGWTPRNQARFIAHLAATGSVTSAAASVGLTRASAYALRAAPGAQSFATAWSQAVSTGIAALKSEAFDRALHAQEEPVFHAGQQVGTRKRHNNQLIMRLLTHYDRPEAAAPPSPLTQWLSAFDTPEIHARLAASKLRPVEDNPPPHTLQLIRQWHAVSYFQECMTHLGLASFLREKLEDQGPEGIMAFIEYLERTAFENKMVERLIRAGHAPEKEDPEFMKPLKDLIHAVRTESYAKAGLIPP